MKMKIKRLIASALFLAMLLGMCPQVELNFGNGIKIDLGGLDFGLTNKVHAAEGSSSHDVGDVGLSWTDDSEKLSSSRRGKVNYTTTTTGLTLSAIAYNGSVFKYAAKSTLTITNNGLAGYLEFDWEFSGKGSISISGLVTSTGSGTYRGDALLENGGKNTITIKSDAGDNSCTLKISNIRIIVPAETEKVTFKPVDGGDYTVAPSDTTVPQTIQNEVTLEKNKDVSYQLQASPQNGYNFFGWVDGNNNLLSKDNPYILDPKEDMTVAPLFVDSAVFGVGSRVFSDLKEANTYAATGSNKTIVLLNNGTLPAGDYEISAGVTLLIPFDDYGTTFRARPEFAVQDSYTTPWAFRTLTMAPGAKIIVEGELSVSAMTITGQAGNPSKSGAPTGPCGFIDMNEGSQIEICSNAKLYAWGYIVGDGKIIARHSAKVYESMQVTDYRGGSGTTKVMGMDFEALDFTPTPSEFGGTFLFSQYYVQNIEAELTLEYGAQEVAVICVNMGSVAGLQTMDFKFIGDKDGVFAMKEGSTVIKKYNGQRDRLILETYGPVRMIGMSVTMDVKLKNITLNSKDYVLPINGNMTINIHAGSKIEIEQDLALLPGVEMNIEKGAEVVVASGARMYIYDADQWDQYENPKGTIQTGGQFFHGNGDTHLKNRVVHYAYSRDVVYENPGVRVWDDPSDVTDVFINLNGTLTIDGALYTTNGGAQIVSDGAGVVQFNADAGTETYTYQVIQNNTDVTKVYIPITSIQLKNKNEKEGLPVYTSTANTKAGTTYYWNDACKMWVQGKRPDGAVTPHVWSSNNQHYCSVCHYYDPNECLSYDSNKDHVCGEGGCTNTNVGLHSDGNKDHKCDYGCGASFGTHEDIKAPLDHKCDYCGGVASECKDDDRNHQCDICLVRVGVCEDELGADGNPGKDHLCDWGCGHQYGAHSDPDGDHFCDYGCGQPASDCVDNDYNHVCDYGCGNNEVNMELHVDGSGDGNHICDYGKLHENGCKVVITEHVDDKKTDGTNGRDHICDECSAPNIGEHADGDDDNHVCDYCFGDVGETCYDKNPIDHTCDECGKPNVTDCVDENTDHYCDNGCGKYFGEHKDGNDADHLCDHCLGDVGETCYDKNPIDHTCDECGKPNVTDCVDENTDHYCDNGCGKYFSEHKDSETDDNHICDYCKDANDILEDCTPEYSNNLGAGTHNVSCEFCGKDMGQNVFHTYDKDDGKCVCGDAADAVIVDKDGNPQTHYHNLESAISAAPEGAATVITLLTDSVTVKNGVITIANKHVIIQGPQIVTYSTEGATVINTEVENLFTVGEGGVLTLGENLVVNSNKSILLANGGVINVDGAVLNCTSTACVVALADSNGEINVKSGKLTGGKITIAAQNGGKVNISGGEVSNTATAAVHAMNGGVVEITEDGTIYGNISAADGGSVRVAGGSFDRDATEYCDKEHHTVKPVDGDLYVYGAHVDYPWTYSDNDGSTHDATCTGCGVQVRDDEKHIYGNSGECPCGNTAEAKIGSTYYYTFQLALEAAQDGDTITVLKNITLTQAVVVSNKLTINAVEGVTVTTSVMDQFTAVAGGELTLGAGLVVNSNTSILWATAGGIINVDGAVLNSTSALYALAYADGKDSRINVISGKIVSKMTSTLSAEWGAVITVSGGVVKCENGQLATAYSKSGGKIVLTGDGKLYNGTGEGLESYTLIAAEDGIVEMTGGYVSNGVLAHESVNAKATISGGKVDGHVGVEEGATVIVTGGTFEMDATEYCDSKHHTVKDNTGYYIYGEHTDFESTWEYTINEDGTHDATCSGCGRKVTEDVTHIYSETGKCVCGNLAEAKIGDTYYCFFTDAVVAAKAGETVTILQNITLTKAIEVSKKLTINAVEGVTVTTTATDLFTVKAGGELTLGAGLVVNSNTSILWATAGGIINVDGAVLNSTSALHVLAYADGKDSRINVISGEIVSKMTSTLSAEWGAVITVSGGVVKCENGQFATAYSKYGGKIVLTGDGELYNGTGEGLESYTLIAAEDGIVEMTGGYVSNGVLAHESVNAKATISGGKVDGHVGVEEDATVIVTGGAFEMDATKYCGYMFHTVKDESGYYVYGEHEYTLGHCACGHLQDLNVSLVVKAEGSDDNAKPVGTIKYGYSYKLKPDFSSFGDCYTMGDISVVIGDKLVDDYTYVDGVLTIEGKYVTGDIEIVVIAVQRHTVGKVVMENYVAPSFDDDGSYDLVVYCAGCKNIIKKDHCVIENSQLIAVVQIGETKYESLDKAMAAANVGDTIELLANVTIDGEKVWDLSGITLKIKDGLTIRGKLVISGGNFVIDGQKGFDVASSGSLKLYGGSYNVDVKNYLADGYCMATADGTYTVAQHIAGQVQVENVEAATCTKKGSYDNVTYCVHCGEQMSRDTVTVDVLAHTYDAGTVTTNPTCTVPGVKTYKCTCGDTKTESIPATGHTAGEAVIEIVANATCTDEGSYNVVTYCNTCHTKLSSKTIITDPLGHDWTIAGEEAATCTKNGKITYKCTRNDTCNATKTEEISATGHTAGEVVTKNYEKPTCTDEGGYDMVVYCSTCKGVISSTHTTVEATGHKYVEHVVPPTCTEAGYTTYTCACGLTYNDNPTAATGHHFMEAVTTAPTCTEKGIKTFTCRTCGHERTEEIAATGHDWDDGVVTQPTCTEGGYTTYTCANCSSNDFRNYTAANGHDFDDGQVETAPTCTGDGRMVYTCHCGATQYEAIEATGHSHDTVVTDPTCLDMGYSTHTCPSCGDSFVDNLVPAAGHKWDAGVVTDPTCTMDGYTTYTCTRCHEVRVDDYVDATGHHYEFVVTPPTCTGKGYTTYTCACGYAYNADEVDATGHDYTSEVTLAPTCDKVGIKLHTCSNCGDEQEEKIPATGHNYVETIVPPSCTMPGYATYTCSECGDSYDGDDIPATGHTIGTIVTENYKAPNCTEAGGYDMVIYCATCEKQFRRVHWTIEATGHNYVVTEKAPTCTEAGCTTYTCACGDTYSEEIKATGHDYEAVVTAPTCTEDGYTTYTCACGYSYVGDKVEAKGHTEGEVVKENVKDSSYDEVVYCTECEEELSRETIVLVVYGDVNNDGKVDIMDANLVCSHYNELITLTETQLLAADVNGDGIVNIMDANLICSYYNELIEVFPVATKTEQ